mgnify:CR=1 FL=1
MSARKLPPDITRTALEQRRNAVKNKEPFTAEDFCMVVNSAVQNHRMTNKDQPTSVTRYKKEKPAEYNVTAIQGAVNTERQRTGGPSTRKCLFCQGSHWITECNEAKKKDHRAINNKVKINGGCLRCLRSGHLAAQCEFKTSLVCHNCKDSGHNYDHHFMTCFRRKKLNNTNPRSEDRQNGKHVQHQATMNCDESEELDTLLAYDPEDQEESSKKTVG